MIDLVVFLGNPGPEYERTRHNAAWFLAEQLPFYPSLVWQKKHKGLYAPLETDRLSQAEDPVYPSLAAEGLRTAGDAGPPPEDTPSQAPNLHECLRGIGGPGRGVF